MQYSTGTVPAACYAIICMLHGMPDLAIKENCRLRLFPEQAAGQSRGSTTRAMSSHSSCHGRRLLRREASLYILPDLLQQRSSELGGLELDSLIGRGSFGRVFKGAIPLASRA